MKRKNFIGFSLMLAVLLNIGQVQAVAISDRWTDDLNTITSVDSNNGTSTVVIVEDYREDSVIPYPSHDGYAVVDFDYDQGESVRYFDKIVDLEGATGIWEFKFEVTNNTPWRWSDYHFEFYDVTFTNELDVTGIISDWSNSVIFTNSDQSGNELQFWDDAPNNHFIGDTHTYTFNLDTSFMPSIFGLRQIATAPEPTTVLLMCLGLSFLGYKRYTSKI
ncbi:MAG: hypothetical protein methR_P0062 [Methyloprofundus sp.]|nr:MAG: hypothetical protein methR_P0062 [Methyloprofundus sp.]